MEKQIDWMLTTYEKQAFFLLRLGITDLLIVLIVLPLLISSIQKQTWILAIFFLCLEISFATFAVLDLKSSYKNFLKK